VSQRAIDLLKAGPHTSEAVDGFIATHTFPLVEGPAITFVWRGTADAVHLKHWVFGLPSSQELARVEGTNLFYLTLELPAGSRVEYKLEVVRGGQGEWIQDPLNSAQARDPFGSNSVAHGEGYAVPAWIHPDPRASRGAWTSCSSRAARSGAAASASTFPPGSAARGATRCWWCTTGTTTCATRRSGRFSTT